MINPGYALSVSHQCKLLGLARSTLYYRPEPTSEATLALMRTIDALHLAHPFLGSRRIRDLLQRVGIEVGRRHVATLMRKMGITALYRRPRTSQPAPEHKVYPYLLQDLAIERANHVWVADITYLPMRCGFGYLVAIMDWASRKVLAFRLSNTLTVDFCVAALEDALLCYGCPEIFNTDQGAQFTAKAFTAVLKQHEVAISMDGRGRWTDNLFIERLWRSVKYEEVYLKAYETLAEARIELRRYITFYNTVRPHQGLGRKTPDEVYFATLAKKHVA